MATYSFKQGEDIKIPLEVKDNGVSVDVSASPKIKCVLKTNNGTLVKKYSLTAETDYGVLEVDATDNWTVNLFIERSESVAFPLGILKAYLSVAFVDAGFPDGIRVKEYPFTVGMVFKGETTEEDMTITP